MLKVKQEIESRWPDVLSVFFDVELEEWIVVEKCADGVERLAMKTKKLDMGVVEKLNRIDQAKHAQGDLNQKHENEDKDVERKKDHNLTEAIGEGAEKLFFALRKDGVINAPKVHFGSAK